MQGILRKGSSLENRRSAYGMFYKIECTSDKGNGSNENNH